MGSIDKTGLENYLQTHTNVTSPGDVVNALNFKETTP